MPVHVKVPLAEVWLIYRGTELEIRSLEFHSFPQLSAV